MINVSRNVRWLAWGFYVGLWTIMLLLPLSAVESLPGQELVQGYQLPLRSRYTSPLMPSWRF